MSRVLSDVSLLALADKVAWWIPSWKKPERMCSLREVIGEAMAQPDCGKAILFRAGGFGEPAIWLKAADMRRLWNLMSAPESAA